MYIMPLVLFDLNQNVTHPGLIFSHCLIANKSFINIFFFFSFKFESSLENDLANISVEQTNAQPPGPHRVSSCRSRSMWTVKHWSASIFLQPCCHQPSLMGFQTFLFAFGCKADPEWPGMSTFMSRQGLRHCPTGITTLQKKWEKATDGLRCLHKDIQALLPHTGCQCLTRTSASKEGHRLPRSLPPAPLLNPPPHSANPPKPPKISHCASCTPKYRARGDMINLPISPGVSRPRAFSLPLPPPHLFNHK